MELKIKSEGKCLFCGKTFAKAGINRHLATHLSEKVSGSDSGKSFLVKIETGKNWGSAPYFLSLWIDGEAKMEELDTFLRNIWLECCGHLSAFTNPKRKTGHGWNISNAMNLFAGGNAKAIEAMMDDTDGEIPMSRKTKNALHKGLVLAYEYDFGSTTKLTVTVIDEYPIKADEKIILLSRNEPLEINCSICGKVPATQVCTVCMYDEDSAFCDKCAKKHAKACPDFADYASMPVVNSPRMSVCGYKGGTIDKERDGVYKM